MEESKINISLKKYIKKCDLNGVYFHPKIFHSRKYISIPSSLITILFFLIIFSRIFILIYDIISKSNFNFKYEKDFELNKSFIINDLNIQICFFEEIELNNFFTNFIQEIYSVKNSYEIYDNYFIPCYLFKFENISLKRINTIFQKENLFFFYFSFPKNKLSYDTFIIYNITYINPNDYFHPKKNKGNYIILNNLDKNSKYIEFNLEKIKVSYENKLFSFFYNSFNRKEKEYSSLNSYNIYNENGEYNLKIGINYSGWISSYKFIGFNFEEEISLIGGLISIIYIIESFFGRMMNNFFLEKEIRNYTKNSELNYKMLNDKKYNKLSLKSFTHISTNNSNYKNLGTLDFLFLKDKSNIINKIKNKSIVNKISIKTDNTNINNKNTNASNFTHNNKLGSEYIHFHKLLDYYIIFQMIKDVNLLKLLCLNNISAQLFYQFRHKNINILKLDKFMEKESINNDLHDNFFDNLNEKINLLNSF